VRVWFTNLGCKLNRAELERLAREFVGAGHRIAPSLPEADLHVVNSCTVTRAAARDSRKLARRGRRANPALRTVMTGCWVAEAPEDAARLAGVDLVVPNDAKHELLARVHTAFPELRPLGVADGPLPVPYVPLEFGNARALVKIEDGCNMNCSFCIIPRTRGRQRSRPAAEVLAEVKALERGGFREIVVTGVQISAYRRPGRGLYELVAELLGRTHEARLRLTSIAPWQFDRRLLELFASGRLCRHLHLSLQSGCDRTLKRMRRPYDTAAFAALVAEARAAVPDVAITTDVIVGFPGETGDEFDRNLEFVRRIGFARVHAFPYSERPATEAATLPGAVAQRLRKRRMKAMLAVAERSARRFRRGRLGDVASILWERRDGDLWRGTTDHYIPVVAAAEADLARRLTAGRLVELAGDGRSVTATLGRGAEALAS